jgi:hypothetical protein
MAAETGQSKGPMSEAEKKAMYEKMSVAFNVLVQDEPELAALLTGRPPRRVRQSAAGVDRWEHLRQLPVGGAVEILETGTAPRFAQYSGQTARKVRTPRAGSRRMLVVFDDGKQWYWPMDWLAPCTEGAAEY